MQRASVLTAAAVFGAIALAGGGLFAFKWRALHPPAAPGWAPSETVEVVTARQVDWQPMADLVGTVFALRSVELKNELAGRVRSVSFQSDQVVEAGARRDSPQGNQATPDQPGDRPRRIDAEQAKRPAQARQRPDGSLRQGEQPQGQSRAVGQLGEERLHGPLDVELVGVPRDLEHERPAVLAEDRGLLRDEGPPNDFCQLHGAT